MVNLLSAVLALCATLFYVFVYTLWLKRTSTQNIVIGGAAGAVPVLVGWAAVARLPRLGPPACCSPIIFVWTPPHFWALAVRYRDDYAAADVPMLPAVADMHTVAVRILGYTVVLWALTLLFGPVAGMGTSTWWPPSCSGRSSPGTRGDCCRTGPPGGPCASSPGRSRT